MIALSVSDLSLSFGTDVILSGISFSVNDGEKVGIVGVNGAGKTSLFRLITGQYAPDSGAVYIQRGHTVGVLEQNADLSLLPGDMTMLEYMYTAFPALLALEEEIRGLEDALAAAPADPSQTLRSLTDTLHEKNQAYRDGGGLEFRARCRSMLLRLGFDEYQIGQHISTLSGGQYTRLSLARLLATEPDILMLDEPTNHLDIDALVWLEGYLSTYKKTVLVISHDRYFLDKVTDHTLILRHTRGKLYPGGYTAARTLEEAQGAAMEKRYQEQQKEIARIRANIEFQRRCNREHNFVTIRSKEKQIARMEKLERAPKAERAVRMNFTAEEESAGDVIIAKNLSFSYTKERPLIRGVTFLIRQGERVMFLGPNGSGKSTLMKLIRGALAPTGGTLTLGYNIKIGYYDQENRGLSENKTVFSEMHDEYPTKKDLELRSTLALFLFGAEDMNKPVSALSGGERARLTLAKLMLKKVNLLVLDEPTNHLDFGSCEALENAVLAFPGTVVAVSHDRYFINRLATRLIELDPAAERGAVDYPLGEDENAFDEYMRLRELRRQKQEAETPAAPVSRGKLAYEAQKKEAAARRGEERKRERAQARVAALEKELEEVQAELFGSAAADYVRAAALDKRKSEIEEELLSLYELIL